MQTTRTISRQRKQISKKKKTMIKVMMKNMSLVGLTKTMLKMRAKVILLKISMMLMTHNSSNNIRKNKRQSVSRVADSNNSKMTTANKGINAITTKMLNTVVMSSCSVINHLHHIHTNSKDSNNNNSSSSKMHNTIHIKPSRRQ